MYSTLFLQARYLLQYDIQTDISGKLRWYLGGGIMFKGSKVSYQYRVIQDPVVYSRRKNDVDLGVEAPVGVEYDFEGAPFNVFLELSPMIEIADRPGAFRVFIGLGGRYRF
ncbi:MAG: hypothetical protein HC859_00630 [Bacteroidia bacterium]|nr:hypothetical protein [Bacteroidia bacterium]